MSKSKNFSGQPITAGLKKLGHLLLNKYLYYIINIGGNMKIGASIRLGGPQLLKPAKRYG